MLRLSLFVTAEDWDDDGEHTDNQVLGCQVLGYISYACSFLFACLILFLRKQITLANGIVKASWGLASGL